MNCTVYAAWTLNFHFEQITTSLSQLEKSSWMKAEQAFKHEIRKDQPLPLQILNQVEA